MGEHHTEADGWSAEWLLDHHCVRMMLVRNVSDPRPLMSAPVPAVAPDLAEMRERFPQLSSLWDAVRREYWSASLTFQENFNRSI
jgi:hypothetical protein